MNKEIVKSLDELTNKYPSYAACIKNAKEISIENYILEVVFDSENCYVVNALNKSRNTLAEFFKSHLDIVDICIHVERKQNDN